MAVLYRALGICVIFTVLGQWLSVAAVDSSSMSLNSSPLVSTPHGSATSTSKVPTATHHIVSSTASEIRTTIPSIRTSLVHSHKTSVIPSHHATVTPTYNMTILPSHNMTATPHSKTIMPSHNMTAVPHSKTIVPSHNMTAMPHSKTIMPSHNMTIMPSSTHTVMPTSSVHPTLPPPKAGNFTIEENNTVCLFAYMAATFDLMMESKRMPGIVLPVNAAASGACDKSNKKPFVMLQWQTKEGSYNFTMHFVNIGKSWAAANLSFSLVTAVGDSVAATFHSATGPLTQLSAKVGHAFQCTTKATEFKLTAINSTVNVSLTDIEFQPFDVKGGHLSKEVDECAPPPPPATTNPPVTATTTSKKKGSHVVAIAVGCTLAGLVVIVAIGYLIARRRSRSSGGYRKL